ncbi:hypothetical protein NDU88_004956 [Pleurodeles waltl]|uniref:Uncharacterized protein n=1 Tax=Pleurodeles waltl TaxID=8319 RepID=A0AAV7SKA9_PLEWA|nr:hypothetical protein NDU88_004956 [Pleurodeles waltl]
MGRTVPEPMWQTEHEVTTENAPVSLADSKLNKILAAIADTWQDLCGKVKMVAVELGLLRDDHRKLIARIMQLECRLAEIHPALSKLEDQVRSLANKVRDLENREEDTEEAISLQQCPHCGFRRFAEGCTPSHS